jgi:hypothetical protein
MELQGNFTKSSGKLPAHGVSSLVKLTRSSWLEVFELQRYFNKVEDDNTQDRVSKDKVTVREVQMAPRTRT